MNQKDIDNTRDFDRYTEQEMTEAERQRFEAALEKDEVLQEEFLLYQKIVETLEQSKEKLLTIQRVREQQAAYEKKQQALFKAYYEQTLSEAEKIKFEQRLAQEQLFLYEWTTFQQEQNKIKVVALRKRLYYGVIGVAAIALLGLLAYWGLTPAATTNYDTLVAEYYSLPNNYLTAVNENIVIKGAPEAAQDELLQKGLIAYTTKDYDSTIYYLTQYRNAVGATDTAYMTQLYIGMAHYEQNSTDKAIATLQAGSENIQDLAYHRKYRDLMQWHLALAYLKANKKEEAIRTLTYLAKEAEYLVVKEDAVKLLKALE